MKKILIVMPITTLDWGSKSSGGVDSVCQILLNQLAKEHKTHFNYRIIAFNPHNDCAHEGKILKVSKNIDIVQFNSNGKIFHEKFRIPGTAYQTLKIREQIKLFNPDLIHTHLSPWTLAKPRKTPAITTLHGYKKICRKPRSIANNILHEKAIPALCEKITSSYTCVSESLKKEVERETSKKIHTIYNPIDQRYFKNKTTPAIKEEIRLVTCAILTRRKGIHHALELLKRIIDSGKNSNLKIIGPIADTAYFELLKEKIRQLSLEDKVLFMGPLSCPQIIEQYKQSDFGVFMSEEETFGLVPIEMIASGLRVITTKVGVIIDLEKHFLDDGYFCIANPNNLEDALNFVSAPLHERKPKNKGLIAEKFSAESIISQYEEVYLKTLSAIQSC